jgi:O-antigen/teichoic acid export membrane protein
MNNKTRIIVNTFAQNVRSIVNIILSLYSTRIVMDALGQSDYGVYMLVAGVVSFLNFFTNSLTLTTQRHLSYSHGAGQREEARAIFANSYLLLLVIGTVMAGILASLTSVIFDGGWLKIDASRLAEAQWVYLLVITSVFMTLLTSPFRALLIAYENIVYISIIEVLDGVLKLSAVFILYYISDYRLTTYAAIIMLVMAFNFLAFLIYCQRKYPESCILPSPRQWNLEIQKKIVGFATWSLYGMGCVLVRTQGVAVLINHLFKGTLLNSSYGIATQIQGSVNFFSSAIHNSIKPQIIKAEGAGDHERAIRLSETACKFGFLILMLVVTPIVAELPAILGVWLKEVPPMCVAFGTIILISALTDQLSIGLTLIVSASGRIRNFTLWSFTVKTLALPAMYFGVEAGLTIDEAFIFYWVFEALSAMTSILYICHNTGETLSSYLRSVVFRVIPPLLFVGSAAYASSLVFDASPWRIIVTGIITTLVGIAAIWALALNPQERTHLRSVITSKFKKTN